MPSQLGDKTTTNVVKYLDDLFALIRTPSDPGPSVDAGLALSSRRADFHGAESLELDGLAVGLDKPSQIVDLTLRYDLGEVLGRGGMGIVQLGVDRRLQRTVAIKRLNRELRTSRTAMRRFLTEAQATALLNHRNIVQIHDYGEAVDGPYIVMEWVDGPTLSDVLTEGPLEHSTAVELIDQLCQALSATHSEGVIHRDIKPGNVLLTSEGVPKLTDFGLARQETIDEGQTQVGTVLGTLDYMPPEQRKDAARTDVRSDVWSLAATFYEMLTGEVPRGLIRPDRLPAEFESVFLKALEHDPDARYQTADEFRQAVHLTVKSHLDLTAIGLKVGQCTSCGHVGDGESQFCESCGESVLAPCCSCQAEIKPWATFCYVCGINVAESLDQRCEELRDQQRQVETFRGQFRYAEAVEQLTVLLTEEHPRFATLRDWARDYLAGLKLEQRKMEERKILAMRAAEASVARYEHDEVVRVLESVPVAVLGEVGRRMLSDAKQSVGRTNELYEMIRSAVKENREQGVQQLVDEYLALKPDDEAVLGLRDQLRQRRDRQRIKVLKLQIRQAVSNQEFEGLLPAVEEYLEANPDDVKIQSLAKRLRSDEEQRIAIRRRNMLLVAIVGSILFVFSVVVALLPTTEPLRDERETRADLKPSDRRVSSFELLIRSGVAYNQKKEFDKAIADFTEAIRLKPDDYSAYWHRGFAHNEKKEYDKAIADLTEAIRLKPDDYHAYHNRGVVYNEKKEYDKAISNFTEAILLKPDDYLGYSSRGFSYRLKGEWDEAIADLTEAIRLKPDDLAAYGNRGVAYNQKKEFDKAISDFTEAIHLKPDDYFGYSSRGFSHRLKGEWDEAIADLTEAIRLKPDDHPAYWHRGVAYNEKKEYFKAISDFTEAIYLKPDDYLGYSSRGFSHRLKGEWDEAIVDLTEAIRLKPDDYHAYGNRGFAYNGKKEFDKAIADLTEAIRLKPDDHLAYHNRGVVYNEKKEYDKAISDFTEAILLKPDDYLGYSSRGFSYRLKGEWDEAIADLTEAIRLKPDDLAAYGNRGVAYNQKKEFDKAIADFTEAIRLKPDDYSAYWHRGFAHNKKKECDKAIADLTEAIRLKPDDYTAYGSRGFAYNGKKEYDKAIADFTEAIRLKPDDYNTAYGNRGLAYNGKKEYDKAIADFTEAIRLKPDDYHAYGNRAVAFRQKGEGAKAFVDTIDVCRLKPDHRAAYKNLGDPRRQTGESDNAILILEIDAEKNPEDYRRSARVGISYHWLKKYPKAITFLSKAILLKPDEQSSRLWRGRTYMETEEYDKAIGDFTEAIRLEPDDPTAYKYRGLAYQKIGNEKLADADFKKASSLTAEE